ncbi:MAG: hypothetical protein ACTHKT_01665 [Solirubrobacterales bacterium]
MQIGLAVCMATGVGFGLLVALVNLDAQVVYGIGLAVLVALGAMIAFLRGYEVRQAARLRNLYLALGQQSKAIAEVQLSLGEIAEKRELSLLSTLALLKADADLAAEHPRLVEQLPRLAWLEEHGPIMEEFRTEVRGLLEKYEAAELPSAEQEVWPILLGLSLYEVGLSEITKVEQGSEDS